ncbi:hypothetical protein F2Q68_00035196 [Brassica cretica]|uniref:Small ribosomal subunit protein mS23 n=1 Tax=Brassica cretica TaxID=69181 RepID=A0A8S9HBA1_BRACR|nr:hypothetical protein F2Q68_00035196 [Brassica cretica]
MKELLTDLVNVETASYLIIKGRSESSGERASKKATMSWMKGDLLSKTRRLVGGLATREPVWLKAMEASPPPVFPRSNGNLKKIVLPEDPYVRRFARKHPEAKLVDPNK